MPPVIVFRERINFYNASKNSDETVNNWYARVKSLALKRKFSNLDEAVRDKFITGMASDERLFEKFCEMDEKLTAAASLNKALIHEVKLKGKLMSNDVNLIQGRGNNYNNKHKPNRANGNQHKKETCKHCGWKHKSATCKFKDAICDQCGRKGHLKLMCRAKEKNLSTNFVNLNHPISQVQKSNADITTFVNTGTQVAPMDDEGASRYLSIFNISDGSKSSDTFDLTVCIDNIRFDVECDTGSPISLMPLVFFNKHFDRLSLRSSNDGYNDYGGHPIKISGEYLPTIKYREQSKKMSMVVTNVNRPILLGRNFLRAFGFELKQVNAITISETELSNTGNQSSKLNLMNFVIRV